MSFNIFKRIYEWRNTFFFAVMLREPMFYFSVLTFVFLLCVMILAITQKPYVFILILLTQAFNMYMIITKSANIFYYDYRKSFKVNRHTFWYVFPLPNITYGDFYRLINRSRELNIDILVPEDPVFNEQDVKDNPFITKHEMPPTSILVKYSKDRTVLSLLRGL